MNNWIHGSSPSQCQNIGENEMGKKLIEHLRLREAHDFLVRQARSIKHPGLRVATLDLLQNRKFCVQSRAGVDDSKKATLLASLQAAGLINSANDVTFPGGLRTGAFPPVTDAATACPRMPMSFDAGRTS
jgi:hypothetical protein